MSIDLSIIGSPPHGNPRLTSFVNLLDLEYVANHFGYLIVIFGQQRVHELPRKPDDPYAVAHPNDSAETILCVQCSPTR